MPMGEMLYLAMCLTAAVTFVAVVGTVSVWSRRPPGK